MRDLDLIDPKIVMESLPDIAILLHRQFKDQGRQITLHWETWHCIGLNANIFWFDV
jgi:hypothetical protein